MKLLNTYTYKIKKSKFIAYYYEVTTKENVEIILNQLKQDHKKARHIVYCYMIDSDIKKHNDGEPLNTAGSPIYNIMNIHQLNHRMIVIVRYFGGILLGAGPLTRAYLTAAKEVIKLTNK